MPIALEIGVMETKKAVSMIKATTKCKERTCEH